MARLAPAAVRRQIAAGTLDPLYLLAGDDQAEISALLADFEASIDEGTRAFNVDRFHGNDPALRLAAVADACRTLPMMAGRRLVVVLQGERLFAGRKENESTEQDERLFEEYLDRPEPLSALVIAVAALDERRRVVKKLLKQATVVLCVGPQDAGEAQAWVRARFAEQGVTADARAVALLVERAGLDAGRLRADIDRVVLYAAPDRAVSEGHVKAVVGGESLQDNWAMSRAIERGQTREALHQLALHLDNGDAPEMLLGQIRAAVAGPSSRLPESRLARGVDALMRTDLALKSSSRDLANVLLERLIVELCER